MIRLLYFTGPNSEGALARVAPKIQFCKPLATAEAELEHGCPQPENLEWEWQGSEYEQIPQSFVLELVVSRAFFWKRKGF